MKNVVKLAIPLAMVSALSACGGGGSTVAVPVAVPASVLAASGYTVSVFAQAPGKSSKPPTCDPTSPNCYTKPDSIVQMGTGSNSTIFMAYQDGLQPNGTISATNAAQGNVQIVQYDLNGNQLKTYTVRGHNDGLMVYDSHTLWAMSNEDSNPMLSIIDTNTGTVTTYADDTAPSHGGGLDDMQKIGNTVYVSASAPKLNTTTGLYDQPAIVALTLNPDGKTFHTTPVLMGNATATVINPAVAGLTTATNMLGNPLVPNSAGTNPAGLQDPDSMTIDPSGNLVLDSQTDSELVFVTNPGPNQTVKELFLTLYTNPWPVDDTRWAPSSSQFMLVTDTKAGLIYKVTQSGGFAAGAMYSAGQGTVLQDDPPTGNMTPGNMTPGNMTPGNMTPVITGMSGPHGMLFVQ